MATWEFDQDGFEKKAWEAARKKLEDDLRKAGVRGVKVKITPGRDGKCSVDLSGSEAEVEKAKTVLAKQK